MVSDRGPLKVDALTSFAVFARHQNFTKAAEELHIAQPSLHAKINKLARALDVELYERAGRGLRLTEAGERLAAFAADHDRQADDFVSMLENGPASLTLATGRVALRFMIDEAVRRLIRAGCRLSVLPVNRTQALDLVKTGAADVAAVAYDPPPRGLRSRHLGQVDQVLLMPKRHPLAASRSLRLSDLEGLSLVVPPEGRPHRYTLDRALAAEDVSWTVAAEADGWDMIVHLASIGLGPTVVNGCIATPRSLVAVPISDLPAVGYWLAWRPQRENSVVPLLAQLEQVESPVGNR